jgi:hypothetical protein
MFAAIKAFLARKANRAREHEYEGARQSAARIRSHGAEQVAQGPDSLTDYAVAVQRVAGIIRDAAQLARKTRDTAGHAHKAIYSQPTARAYRNACKTAACATEAVQAADHLLVTRSNMAARPDAVRQTCIAAWRTCEAACAAETALVDADDLTVHASEAGKIYAAAHQSIETARAAERALVAADDLGSLVQPESVDLRSRIPAP